MPDLPLEPAPNTEPEPVRPPSRVSALAIGGCAAILCALWAIELFVIRTHLLATHEGRSALVPLYAFFEPRVVPRMLLFAAAGLALVLASKRLADPARVSRARFAAALVASALVLALADFMVRDDPSRIGREFVYYQNDEFYFDALRIVDLGAFLRHYVELMPQLSLHGRHFPPGHATLLHLVASVFGSGTLPAGLACLVSFALALLAAYFALLQLTGERDVTSASAAADATVPSRARQGALLLLASPSMLDFACTSMDAVFLLFATLAWWLSLRAFAEEARVRDALLAGSALFAATFFSFSALPLGLAIGLYALLASRGRMRRALTHFVLVGASYAACALLVEVATGFSIVDCLAAARSGARELMDRAAGRPIGDLWLELSFGNALAFALGAGVALVAAAARGAVARRPQPWTIAAIVTLAVMSCGGIYFLETERIWMYAMPWLAAIAVAERAIAPVSLRVLIAVGVAQALVMQVLLFTLW